MSLRIVLAQMCDDTENGWHILAHKNKQQRTHNVFDAKSVYIAFPDGASVHLRQCEVTGRGSQRDTGQ